MSIKIFSMTNNNNKECKQRKRLNFCSLIRRRRPEMAENHFVGMKQTELACFSQGLIEALLASWSYFKAQTLNEKETLDKTVFVPYQT